MKVFIPIGDEIPETLSAGDRLVPYRCGLTLLSQIEFEILDDEGLSRCEAPARPRDGCPAPPPSPS